ncbi:28S ribosomal protein S5, mitochondrial-like [Aethina tumida]|uniref:28S ribosomal protein S5, mitochondrial-like n=1 Tax=Aethina tumida TaxID=116153 RepID=UPI002148DC8F|nr:28S ribosomal protein S5, mitochondrial-like [Aethina tumida]
MHIKIFNSHTVYHDFFTHFGKTKNFVYQKPEGYGLEGLINVNHIIKAFFLRLSKQKTHQEIAEEKRLYLVQLCKENQYFRNVIISPAEAKKRKNLIKRKFWSITNIPLMGLFSKRKKQLLVYSKLPACNVYLKKQANLRNQDVKKHLISSSECVQFKRYKYEEAEEN